MSFLLERYGGKFTDDYNTLAMSTLTPIYIGPYGEMTKASILYTKTFSPSLYRNHDCSSVPIVKKELNFTDSFHSAGLQALMAEGHIKYSVLMKEELTLLNILAPKVI